MAFRRSVGFAATISVIEGLAAFAFLLGITISLQLLDGGYTSSFGVSIGGNHDETAHLVTSLMAREFIASLDFRHPWQFAQQYYFHYPIMAIGHWPPVFYGALGTWFLIVGASRGTSIMFIAIVATTTATIIYFTGKRLIARWAGVLGAVLFLASPLVQESSARVMTEHLLTLAMLVSTLCFARFARTGQTGHGLAFGVIAALAILTHGRAWALGLVPGLTIALTKRWWLLRQPGLWLSAVPVLVTCVPWYVLTLEMAGASWTSSSLAYSVDAIVNLSSGIYLAVGLIVLFFAAIGFWTTIIQVQDRAEVAPEWAALAGLAVATFGLDCIVPSEVESRFMVTVVPSIVLFTAAGVENVAQRLGARLPIGVVRVGLAAAITAGFCAESFAFAVQPKNAGYDALVQDVMVRVSNAPQIWLISSDSDGEGRLVAAVALREAHPSSYVLRAKTILAGGDWYWNNQEDRFNTPEKLAELIHDLSITIIVVDDQISPDRIRPYQERLRKFVTSENGQWALIGSYSQTRGRIVFANSLHVYARRPIASLAEGAPPIPLDRLKALMVRKELR
jgi:hypothetical protein